jgi:2-oxoglutarate dehydrogenase complex dehydrogenase (E1) component-like enzyme
VERGTFSHRHALLTDQEDPHKEQYMPLKSVISEDSKYKASIKFDLDFSYIELTLIGIWCARI